MMLIIDAGNTNISFGIFKLNKIVDKFNIKTERSSTAFEFLAFLEAMFKYFKVEVKEIKEVKIASVVPEVERSFYELFTKIYKIKTTFITNDIIPLKVNLSNPSEVGVDRLINVFSALEFYGSKKNVLIIDFGTTITFDIGLAGFTYEGGVIYPGINLSLESLKTGTSKLPKIALKEPSSPVGKSTSEAINAGIFYGYASMVNGIVKAIEREYSSKFNIYITGGYGKMLSSYLDFKFTIDDNLTLNGILALKSK